jgi:hypothetical protein
MLGMAVPTDRGVISDKWDTYAESTASTKEEILSQWDASTAQLDELFPQIPRNAFKK